MREPVCIPQRAARDRRTPQTMIIKSTPLGPSPVSGLGAAARARSLPVLRLVATTYVCPLFIQETRSSNTIKTRLWSFDDYCPPAPRTPLAKGEETPTRARLSDRGPLSLGDLESWIDGEEKKQVFFPLRSLSSSHSALFHLSGTNSRTEIFKRLDSRFFVVVVLVQYIWDRGIGTILR